MSLVPIRLRRLARSLRSLLVRRLRVTQVGRQWQVVFEPPPTAVADHGDQAVAKHLAAMSLQRRHCMRAQLSQLLGRHPRARHIFRPLAAVEHSLRAENPSSFAALPPAVLRAAQEQLQTLVTDWSALGLNDLRTTLQHALKLHDLPASPTPVMDTRPADSGFGLHVQDASVSMFIEAERDWPPARAPQPAHAE